MQIETDKEIRADWLRWAELLHRLGMVNITAWVLEAAGPLALLGAQALYFGSPLLQPVLTSATIDRLTILLENEEERGIFVDFLRREGKA